MSTTLETLMEPPPRNHALHLVQKYLLARVPVAQVQSKVALFRRLLNVRER